MQEPIRLKKGQTVEVQVESAAFEGAAVAKLDDFVLFVRGAVPGDRVKALVRRKRRKYAEATVEEVIEPSPHRVDPRCPHFGPCGGCRWQNVDYGHQLEFKRQQVVDLLERVGGLGGIEVHATIPSPGQFHYRNKMEFSFGSNRWLTKEEIESDTVLDKGFALGLHIPRRFDKILDLSVCYLQPSPSADLVNWFRTTTRKQGWSAYDARNHTGYLRNLTVRNAVKTGEVLVNLVTSRNEPDRMHFLTGELIKAFPEITTFINSVNSTRSPVAAGEETIYHGQGKILEQVGDLRFSVSPTTFFQPNPLQAENLFGIVRSFAELDGSQTVFDLYTGIGCIALLLSRDARLAVGVESTEQAVSDSRENASANGIANARFHAADAEDGLRPGFLQVHGKPDCVILDPPRSGLTESICRRLLEVRPPRVVYVSCNPATQARDLRLLDTGFSVEASQPVDMFPHTYHIENVVKLLRKAN
jgi:23S rRNA (uracil1939-C5)-methyltransferase